MEGIRTAASEAGVPLLVEAQGRSSRLYLTEEPEVRDYRAFAATDLAGTPAPPGGAPRRAASTRSAAGSGSCRPRTARPRSSRPWRSCARCSRPGERRADHPRVPRRGRPPERVAAGGARAAASLRRARDRSRPRLPRPQPGRAARRRRSRRQLPRHDQLRRLRRRIRRTRRARGRRLRVPPASNQTTLGSPSSASASDSTSSRARAPTSNERSGCASGSRASGRTPSRGGCRSTTDC